METETRATSALPSIHASLRYNFPACRYVHLPWLIAKGVRAKIRLSYQASSITSSRADFAHTSINTIHHMLTSAAHRVCRDVLFSVLLEKRDFFRSKICYLYKYVIFLFRNFLNRINYKARCVIYIYYNNRTKGQLCYIMQIARINLSELQGNLLSYLNIKRYSILIIIIHFLKIEKICFVLCNVCILSPFKWCTRQNSRHKSIYNFMSCTSSLTRHLDTLCMYINIFYLLKYIYALCIIFINIIIIRI